MDPNTLWHFQELFKRVAWIAEQQLKAENCLLALQNQLQTVSQQLESIEKKLSDLENQPTTRIDRIEYRFEQLKVGTLSGSLQIGLTHGAKGLIEDLEAGDISAQNVKLSEPEEGEAYTRAMANLQDYLGAGLSRDIDEAAQQAKAEVPPELHDKIVEDLSRQAELRFMAYLKDTPFKEGSDEEAVQTVMEKIRNDVRAGLASFFDHYGEENAT